MKSLLRLIIKILSLFKGLLSKKKIEKTESSEDYLIKQENKKVSLLLKHYEMIDGLREQINQEVEIHSKNLIFHQQNQISSKSFRVMGRILEVDDHWIKMEYFPSKYLKVRGPDYLYFRTEVIIDFTPIQSENHSKELSNTKRI